MGNFQVSSKREKEGGSRVEERGERGVGRGSRVERDLMIDKICRKAMCYEMGDIMFLEEGEG